MATSSQYVATGAREAGSHGEAHTPRFILGRKATSWGGHKTHHTIYMTYLPISEVHWNKELKQVHLHTFTYNIDIWAWQRNEGKNR